MKLPAYIFASILFLTAVTTAYAGSVNVNIKNKVNSDDSSQISSSTHTKVNISQEGEGTSSVTVNGKEWKLEGPGEINVDETSQPEEDEPEDENETPNPSVTPPVDETSEDSFAEILKERFEIINKFVSDEIRETFQKFFSIIFGIE